MPPDPRTLRSLQRAEARAAPLQARVRDADSPGQRAERLAELEQLLEDVADLRLRAERPLAELVGALEQAREARLRALRDAGQTEEALGLSSLPVRGPEGTYPLRAGETDSARFLALSQQKQALLSQMPGLLATQASELAGVPDGRVQEARVRSLRDALRARAALMAVDRMLLDHNRRLLPTSQPALRARLEAFIPSQQQSLRSDAEQLVRWRMELAETLLAMGDVEGGPAEDAQWDGALAWLGPAEEARLLGYFAKTLANQGRFREALTEFDAAWAALGVLEDTKAHVELAVEHAGLLRFVGDDQRALEAVQEARAVLEAEAIQPRSLGAGGGGLAGALLGLLAKLTAQAEASLSMTKARLDLDFAEGLALSRLGRAQEALERFERVRPVVQGTSDAEAALEGLVGEALLRAGRPAEALERLAGTVGPMLRSTRSRHSVGKVLTLISEALLELGEPEAALEWSHQASRAAALVGDAFVRWRVWHGHARQLAAAGCRHEALRVWRAAAQAADTLRRAPLGHRFDSTLLQERLPLYEEAIATAADLNEPLVALDFMERVKSRTLLVTLSAEAPPASETEAARALRRLGERLDAVGHAVRAGGWTPELRVRADQLEVERAELLARAKREDPRLRTLAEAPAPDLVALDAVLEPSGLAALSLFDDGVRVVALLRLDGRSRVASRVVDPEARAALVEWQRALEQEGAAPADVGAIEALSADRFIPAALLREALGAEGLLLSPHRALHLLPWPATRFEGRRLFERLPVSLVPNLGCVPLLAGPPLLAPRFALFGAPEYAADRGLAPLLGAEDELDGLAELHGAALAACVRGREATEAAWWRLAQDPAIHFLHVACHGRIDPEQPLAAALQVVDGEIDAAELAAARLGPAELMLSACSTGHRPTRAGGVRLSGDDILGLPGALLEAGARGVIVSIPPADDEGAAAFSLALHRHRRDGSSPMRAFQQAQLELLNGRFLDPERWAGFVLHGGLETP